MRTMFTILGAMIEKYGFVENSPVKSPWLAQVLRDEELGITRYS